MLTIIDDRGVEERGSREGALVKRIGFESQSLLFISCVSLNKLFQLSIPQFLPP
jgi:hypothetical protein